MGHPRTTKHGVLLVNKLRREERTGSGAVVGPVSHTCLLTCHAVAAGGVMVREGVLADKEETFLTNPLLPIVPPRAGAAEVMVGEGKDGTRDKTDLAVHGQDRHHNEQQGANVK